MDAEKSICLMQGNEAVVEGAIAAGMRFYSGYPITPSTEISELAAERLPEEGGVFIQMEDEIAGIAAAIGASLAGLKSMTATSGPGFSLKQENIGYAMMAEIPLVVVNVQRGGPSTGLPTASAQGDVMQARWGTHGDHPVIALCPDSVSETYRLTVRAFNLSEQYRTPVILLTDEVVSHMRERVELPSPDQMQIFNRLTPECSPEEYLPYGVLPGETVPRMASVGDGYRHHVTGLFHDETGFPTTEPLNADQMLQRLMNKVNLHLDDLLEYEEFLMEDADFAVFAYGSTSRTARAAVRQLREAGLKVGLFRPVTLWPFPEAAVAALGRRVQGVLVAEMNLGQMVYEVQRVVAGAAAVHHIGRANGDLPSPSEIADRVREVWS